MEDVSGGKMDRQEEIKRCPKCKGDGEIAHGGWFSLGMRVVDICPKCNGTGKVRGKGGEKMNWRPDNWEKIVANDGTDGYCKAGRLYIEGGADNMLEALRQIHSREGFDKMVEVILKPD